MSAIDIYDEEKIARLLRVQRSQGINFDREIDWGQSIDLTRPLLPLDSNAILFPKASDEERLAISQLMGLIVAATFSELEDIACKLKGPTWENVLRKYPVNPEIYEMGELFFEDERKHSLAFKRYIDLFAEKVNVDPATLKNFLPCSKKSLANIFYQFNSQAGGMAIWWLIAAVEEESILIFEHMRRDKEKVDPLYYSLHKCHYEEEIRHRSYASIMLQINSDFSKGTPHSLMFKKVDFIIAEILNIGWTFNQLFKVKNLKGLSGHHPFFKTLAGLSNVLEDKRSLDVVHTLFTTAPYINNMLNLSEHKNIKIMLDHFGAKKIPFKSLPGMSKCIV